MTDLVAGDCGSDNVLHLVQRYSFLLGAPNASSPKHLQM